MRIESPSPLGPYEFVTVQFSELNADTRVFHTLGPEFPEDVRYLVVGSDGEVLVYDTRLLPGGSGWTHDSIVVRANRAPAVVDLLLFCRKPR